MVKDAPQPSLGRRSRGWARGHDPVRSVRGVPVCAVPVRELHTGLYYHRPQLHSYHCLLDVPQCLDGGFELLEAPPPLTLPYPYS